MGRGEEERFPGTTIKVTWTKPRGVESGEEVGMAMVGGNPGGELQTAVLKQQNNF